MTTNTMPVKQKNLLWGLGGTFMILLVLVFIGIGIAVAHSSDSSSGDTSVSTSSSTFTYPISVRQQGGYAIDSVLGNVSPYAMTPQQFAHVVQSTLMGILARNGYANTDYSADQFAKEIIRGAQVTPEWADYYYEGAQ